MEQKELDKENCKKQKNKIDSVFNLQENWKNKVKPLTVITLSSEESDISDEELTVNSKINNEDDNLPTPDDSSGKSKTKFNIKYNEDSLPKPVCFSTPINSADNNIQCQQLHPSINDKITISSINNDSFSIEKKSDNNFSIQLETEQPKFQLKCNKTSRKRKGIETKNESPKLKRGKYLTAHPEVQAYHNNLQNKRSEKKKRKIIQNGQFIRAYPIKGEKLVCNNTCPFDSLMEILSFAYLNFDKFRDFIGDKVNLGDPFFSCLTYYSQFGANVNFYKKRLKYLSSKYPVSNCSINCKDDISKLFNLIMSESHCNYEQIRCMNEKCKHIETIKVPTLNVNAKLVWKNGLDSLKDSINNEFKKK
ncbi:unnamed protein product [Colias eurytheme]|nr:unnamed protein product [Colias eurytheme]